MVFVFYKNHICLFLSVLKKNKKNNTLTLHLYSMCDGIKTLKCNVRITLQLAYHGSKNLKHTHTRITRHVKHTQMVVTVTFMQGRTQEFFKGGLTFSRKIFCSH